MLCVESSFKNFMHKMFVSTVYVFNYARNLTDSDAEREVLVQQRIDVAHHCWSSVIPHKQALNRLQYRLELAILCFEEKYPVILQHPVRT